MNASSADKLSRQITEIGPQRADKGDAQLAATPRMETQALTPAHRGGFAHQLPTGPASAAEGGEPREKEGSPSVSNLSSPSAIAPAARFDPSTTAVPHQQHRGTEPPPPRSAGPVHGEPLPSASSSSSSSTGARYTAAGGCPAAAGRAAGQREVRDRRGSVLRGAPGEVAAPPGCARPPESAGARGAARGGGRGEVSL